MVYSKNHLHIYFHYCSWKYIKEYQLNSHISVVYKIYIFYRVHIDVFYRLHNRYLLKYNKAARYILNYKYI